MNKKKYIEMYKASTNVYLSDVYKSYSKSKEDAYMDCRVKMYSEDGQGFRILSANSFQFTCAWVFRDKSGNKYLQVETAQNSYTIRWEED